MIPLRPLLTPEAALLVTLPTLGGRGHAAATGGAVAEGPAGPLLPLPPDLNTDTGVST